MHTSNTLPQNVLPQNVLPQNTLEKDAAWGRHFAKALREEVVRLAGLCDLPRDAMVSMAGHMDCEALLSVRDALKDAAGQRYPAAPQLPMSRQQTAARGTPEFLI